MPQDWFPIDSNLATKPEVQRVVDRLGENSHVADVIGPLVILWGLVDQHAIPVDAEVIDGEFDGLLPDYTARMLSRTCGGGVSLWQVIEKETSWIQFDSRGVLIKGFERRFGVSSKARARATLRKEVQRSKSVTDVTKAVTSPRPKERKGEERTITGPVGDGRGKQFQQAALEAVASVSESGSARLGSALKDCWKNWDSLRELHSRPLLCRSGSTTFEGKITWALRIESLTVAFDWLVWQSTQKRPLLPATEAAYVVLIAAIKAKKLARPKNPAAAVVALLTDQKSSDRQPVDRSSEWRDVELFVGKALPEVEQFLRPSTQVKEQPKDGATNELQTLESEWGELLDGLSEESVEAMIAGETLRLRALREKGRRNPAVRGELLRRLAMQQNEKAVTT